MVDTVSTTLRMFMFLIGINMSKLWEGDVTLLGSPVRMTLMTGEYENGRVAIFACVDFEHYGKLTVNMPEVALADDEICVKTWSENEHWARQLLEAAPELFTDTGQRIASSYVSAEVWRLTRPQK